MIFVKQLPAAADERLAQSIFVGARRFAEKTQPGVRVADAEHRLRPRAGQLIAARAAGDFLLKHFQRQAQAASLVAGCFRRFKQRCRRCWLPALDFFVIGGSVATASPHVGDVARRFGGGSLRAAASGAAAAVLLPRAAFLRLRQLQHARLLQGFPTGPTIAAQSCRVFCLHGQ